MINKYASEKQYTLYLGNMLEVLDSLPENSVDSIVTDPPYEIAFMSKGWDNTGVAFNVETWKKCLRVLKPGGHLLAFNHSRTFHRMAVAIEDAGFEIRDTIMWVYGSGFPKSLNIGKAIDKMNGYEREVIGIDEKWIKRVGITHDESLTYTDSSFGMVGKNGGKITTPSSQAQQWDGWGTALKPSYEPIILARKPIAESSIAANTLKWGVGGINIDGCRVETKDVEALYKKPTINNCDRSGDKFQKNTSKIVGTFDEKYKLGRFPANLIHDGSDEVVELFPSEIDESGNKESAARFFYTSKASSIDRDAGLDEFEKLTVNDGRDTPIDNAYQRGETARKNIHPTVKPTDLMQYLVRLITPKGGTVLDPFMGSGSTGKAAMVENAVKGSNYHFIGVDMTPEYLPIAQARIEYGIHFEELEVTTTTTDANGNKVKQTQTSIFDFIGD